MHCSSTGTSLRMDASQRRTSLIHCCCMRDSQRLNGSRWWRESKRSTRTTPWWVGRVTWWSMSPGGHRWDYCPGTLSSCQVTTTHGLQTTTGSALDGAVFDIAQILAYLVHNMSRSQLYLGFGHFGWLLFSGNNILGGLWLNCISSVEITLFLLADILLQHRALFQC